MLFRIIIFFFTICFFVKTSSAQVAYSFGADSNDIVSNILLDKFGNIYVAANFANTIVIDKTTQKKITSNNHSQDIIVLKFNSVGKLIWAQKIGGIGKDEVHDMKLDENGNLYLAGGFTNSLFFENSIQKKGLISLGNSDGFIAKILSSNGDLDWWQNIGGVGFDDIYSVAIDNADGVIVSGRFSNTCKMDATSNHLLTSYSLNKNTTTAFVAKYNTYDGKYVYAQTMGITNENNMFQSQSCLITDDKNNCFFVSTFTNNININPSGNAINISSKALHDVVLIKYDVNGKLLNYATIGGLGNENCSNKCLAINSKNELVMAVSFQEEVSIENDKINNRYKSIAETDLLFIKLNNKLSEVVFCKSISDNGMMNLNQILVDDKNDIWLGGYTKKREILISKLNKSKKTKGNLYNSYFMLKATNTGEIIQKKFNNNTTENTAIHSFQYNSFSKDLWISGNYTNVLLWQNVKFKSVGKKDFFITKLRDDFTVWKSSSIDSLIQMSENNFVLDIKSNAQNTLLNLRYMVSNSSSQKINLLDYKGNKIKQMLDGKQPIGLQQIFYDISFLPTGSYFIQVNNKLQQFIR
jgi:hypothetical protein